MAVIRYTVVLVPRSEEHIGIQNSVKVKKGKTVKVRVIGKAPGTKNTYKNTKYAKITSKRTASVLKVKGLKKGKTTLKIKVNGVTLKLKVTVK